MNIAQSSQVRAKLVQGYYMAHRIECQPTTEKRVQPAREVVSQFVRRCSVALVLVVGTGGAMTSDYVAARDGKGYPLQEIKCPERKPGSVAQRPQALSSAENLAYVRSTLKPPVTELAAFFGVSRQAIYNWQSGERISEQNDALLRQLAGAASLLQAHGLAGSSNLLKRKLPGGKNLLEQVRSGEAGESAAKTLIAMIQRESEQRLTLERRLQGRAHPPIDVAQIGSPHFNEQV